MQISIYVINNMPELGRNLAADAYMGRTKLLRYLWPLLLTWFNFNPRMDK